MTLYRERAVVLRTYKLGEADRIVVLLTEGRGKVRAVAKGVRKTKSRFGSRLEPTSHVALLMYEGRELDVVTQAETIEHHRHVREDLGRLTKATAVLEAVDQLAQEGEASSPLYRMVVGALRRLDEHDSPLLVAGFYWKLLAAEGVAPLVDACARCGSDGPLVAFDLVEGGVLCRSCRRGTPLSPGALDLLRRVLGGDLNRALAEPAGPATDELESLATSAMETHLERRLRSLAALHRD
ncbi:MAG TPA: DNA repair protein RecO [Acidimicrobiales bacterium]